MTVIGDTQPDFNAFTEGKPPIAQRPWDVLKGKQDDWQEYAQRKCSDFRWAVN